VVGTVELVVDVGIGAGHDHVDAGGPITFKIP
jgi:hypothetical protein